MHARARAPCARWGSSGVNGHAPHGAGNAQSTLLEIIDMSTTKEELVAEVARVYRDAIRGQVALRDHKSWGAEDAMKVIERLFEVADGSGEGFDLIRDQVNEQVNPSQFRQKLQKLPADHPAYIVPSNGTQDTSRF